MDKEDIKEILTEQRKEFERHIQVLKEDWDSKFQAIQESIKELPTRSEFLEMKEHIERIEDNVELIKLSLRRKVDIENFEALEKRVILLEKKLKTS